jgi:hypothetical protein
MGRREDDWVLSMKLDSQVLLVGSLQHNRWMDSRESKGRIWKQCHVDDTLRSAEQTRGFSWTDSSLLHIWADNTSLHDVYVSTIQPIYGRYLRWVPLADPTIATLLFPDSATCGSVPKEKRTFKNSGTTWYRVRICSINSRVIWSGVMEPLWWMDLARTLARIDSNGDEMFALT